jgi:hypothetical protein
MISILLTDEIDIVHISTDEWGTSTKTTTPGIRARVEDTNRVIKGRDGKELTAEMHILVDPSVTITYEDRIMVKKIAKYVTLISQKECEIKKLSRAHGMSLSHWEVWV